MDGLRVKLSYDQQVVAAWETRRGEATNDGYDDACFSNYGIE